MIKYISINDIPKKNHGRIIDEIEEFLSSGKDACEVVSSANKEPGSVYCTYVSAVRRYKYPLKVIRRNNRIFLAQASKVK